MSLTLHPNPGTIVICDFTGFVEPEMVKRRPVVVISPRLRNRDDLCTVVPLSTTAPRRISPFHCVIDFSPLMPAPYNAPQMWVKGDMICSVAFARLSLPFAGKDGNGKRIYDVRHVSDDDLKRVTVCVLNGMGLGTLTQHL